MRFRFVTAASFFVGIALSVAAVGWVIAPHYLDVKRFEWATYLERSGLGEGSTDVSDWERRTFFECL